MRSQSSRRLVQLLASGFMLGAVLAIGSPPAGAIAEEAETCWCDDNGDGSHKCDGQTKCKAGTEICQVVCV